MDPVVQTVVLAASPLMFGLNLWFIRRSLSNFEDTIRNIAADMRSMTTTVNQQVTAIAVVQARITALETDNANTKTHLRDISGYLSGKGFRERPE